MRLICFSLRLPMNIEIPYNYFASVVPLRCKIERKLEFRAAEPYRVEIPHYTNEEAPIGFYVHKNNNYDNYIQEYVVRYHNGKHYRACAILQKHQSKKISVEDIEDYLYIKKVLIKGRMTKDKQPMPTPLLRQYEVKEIISHGEIHAREALDEFFRISFIIVDDVLHELSGEPRWIAKGGYPYERGLRIVVDCNWDAIVPITSHYPANNYEKIGEDLIRLRAPDGRYYTDDTIEIVLPEAVTLNIEEEVIKSRIQDNQRRYTSLEELIKKYEKYITIYQEEKREVLVELAQDGAGPSEA